MKIAIVSDTHGQPAPLRNALDQAIACGAEAVVHCGDVGSDRCLVMLGGCGLKAWAVAGNMDRALLPSGLMGVVFDRRTVEVPLGDGRFLVATHGDDQGLLEELIGGGQFPYVCHGHTHRARDERVGAVRVICPGALQGPRGSRHLTFALLDAETDTVVFHNVG